MHCWLLGSVQPDHRNKSNVIKQLVLSTQEPVYGLLDTCGIQPEQAKKTRVIKQTVPLKRVAVYGLLDTR
jgi:hypothetical protein